MTLHVDPPYLLFLGDAHDQFAAKTAEALAYWRPDRCVGQLRLEGCRADVGLPDIEIEEAVERGARTLVVGVANRGGKIPPGWGDTLLRALEEGLHLASGLHTRLASIPALSEASVRLDRRIVDVREPPADLPVGNGIRRTGRRLLTVGTDCSVGKMFVALALEEEMRRRGLSVDFRATGQTGILIEGEGIPVDAVVSDFVAGAAEVLSPDSDEDHWDIIEGQGSVMHPSYAAVTLGLLHGSQPDAMVLCIDPSRKHLRGLAHIPSPDAARCIRLYEELAGCTNPEAIVIGVAANTSSFGDNEAKQILSRLESALDLPAVDPLRTGVGPLVDALPA